MSLSVRFYASVMTVIAGIWVLTSLYNPVAHRVVDQSRIKVDGSITVDDLSVLAAL